MRFLRNDKLQVETNHYHFQLDYKPTTENRQRTTDNRKLTTENFFSLLPNLFDKIILFSNKDIHCDKRKPNTSL